eukprot:942984-Heterocapsa_arctica.AAC.1
MCKPWTARTNLDRLKEPLSRRCRHNHQHGECRSSDAVRSGLYTPSLVNQVGKAIAGGDNMA